MAPVSRNEAVRSSSTQNTTVQHSDPVRMHTGRALWRFSHTYSTLLAMLLENVQNAIDAGARRMYIGVDLFGHSVVVCDNGDGVTLEQYRQALNSVAFGKTADDKIGQFGLGMISPLNKCQTMYFMSRPAGQSHVNSWCFEGKEIKEQYSPDIVRTELADFPPLPSIFALAAEDMQELASDHKAPQWRTVIRLDHLVKDAAITRLTIDDLERGILNKFNQWILDREMQIVIKVRDVAGKVEKRKLTPKTFLGHPLEPVVFQTPEAGKITFELYRSRSRNGRREGTGVKILDRKGYPITVREARLQLAAMGGVTAGSYILARDGLEALDGEIFEGYVYAPGLQVRENRDGFEVGDQLHGLCAAINAWYQQVGEAHVNSDKEEAKEARFKDLSQRVWQDLLKTLQESDHLVNLSEELRDRLPQLRAKQEARKKKEETEGKERTQREPSPTRRVVKPRDPSRQSPQGKTQPAFITFAYDDQPGSLYLWDYELETGILTINIRHEQFVRVDETKGRHLAKNDKYVMRLLKWLALEILHLLVQYKELDLSIHRTVIDAKISSFIEIIALGD